MVSLDKIAQNFVFFSRNELRKKSFSVGIHNFDRFKFLQSKIVIFLGRNAITTKQKLTIRKKKQFFDKKTLIFIDNFFYQPEKSPAAPMVF